jgi:hypothetical protein
MNSKPPTPLQVIDNKEVNFAVSNSASGCFCNTCVYYYLPLPGEADPTEVYRDFTIEELPLVIKTTVPVGACMYLVNKNNMLITNVKADQSCEHYSMRPYDQQFEDNVIERTG